MVAAGGDFSLALRSDGAVFAWGDDSYGQSSVPADAETVPGLSAVGWMALAAPAGTSEHIVRRLSEGVHYALRTPSVKQRFEQLGMQAQIMTPAETRAFIEREQKLWWPIVREAESK